MIIKPIFSDVSNMNKVYGISELFIEVVVGAGSGLHSKAEEILSEILTYH